GLAAGEPFLAPLPAFPRAGGEAEDLDLDPAALERARHDVGADRGDTDRPSAHRARVVDQQGDDGVLELLLALALVAQRMARADDHAGQPRGVEQAFFLIEIPRPVLLRHQTALEPV